MQTKALATAGHFRLLHIVLVTLASFVIASLLSSSAYANVSNWNAGRIMDDAVFVNNSSMNVPQIQAFLNSKVPICDTNGTQPSEFGGGTRAQWAAARGFSPPFTCLKDFSEGGKSSAQIIFDAAQEFRINPQVLIVLLQKEQSLITDTWPIPGSSQYRTATGYGCPDTAPCAAQYFGLTNQLRWSARMFRAIMNASPTWFTPYVVGNNFIQFSPNAACGGTVVNIQNRATQALYNYTPYQPNPGALAAGWGQAPCGAYGNRNFYLWFQAWFGSTLAFPYVWNLQDFKVYTSDTKATLLNASAIAPEQRFFVSIKARNTGSSTWFNSTSNKVNLGTSEPTDRQSNFCDSTWIGCSRPASLRETSVAPGQIGTFEFWMKAPAKAGTYKEFFNPVSENNTWLNFIGFHLSLTVKPVYEWQYVRHGAYYSTLYSQANTLDVGTGQKILLTLTAKNTGNVVWRKGGENPVRLATSSTNDRQSVFCDSTWIGCSRAASLKEDSVNPGDNGTFEFWINAPEVPGTYNEYFNLLSESNTWMNENNGLHYTLKVAPLRYTWSYVNQIIYSDQARTVRISQSVGKNQNIYATLQAKNTSNVTWKRDGQSPLRLAASNPKDRNSLFCESSTWIGCSRPVALKENTVAPGEIGTFEFILKTPNTSGAYKEYFNIVAEDKTWLNNLGLFYDFNVQ